MGIFDLFGKGAGNSSEGNEKKRYWNPLKTSENIEDVLLESANKTQVVLKHSNRCAVSFFARNSLSIPEVLDSEDFDLHIIDVIKDRQLSMGFAERVQVRHESPQLFVIRDGEVQWHGSHHSVSAENLLHHTKTN